MAHYYHPHPHHPFPHHPLNYRRPLDNNNNNQHQQNQNPVSPLSSSAVDAEVLTEAQELLNEQFYRSDNNSNEEEAYNDSDGWNKRRSNTKDYRSTKEFRTAGGDSSSTATKRQSEVINFDPEQPIFKPLKPASDENGLDDPFEEEYDDFMKFTRKQNAQRKHQEPQLQPRHFPRAPPRGMMPPPPPPMGEFEMEEFGGDFENGVFFGMPPPPHMMPPMDMPPPPHFYNGPMDAGPMFMSENMEEEEEENYVDRVDFADHGRPVNDRDNAGSVDTFFSDRPATTNSNGSNNHQQQQRGRRRGGPSVYTAEEEELIASMGGMGPPPPPPSRRSTQEFAEAGTQSAMRKSSPTGPMPPQYREEGYLGDCTLKEISMDYGVPITYLADVLATWGVPIPIDPNSRLGDMVTGEQAFAILEAIHTLDVAELHERYAEDDLMNLCDYYDLDIKMAFDFCMERGWALPFGVRTFLRVEQEAELLDALDGGDGGMF